MSDRWSPGIGDPTPMGWITVCLYFVAAVGCASAARREKKPENAIGPVPFWHTLAVFMVLLGINKQLDLQSLFTQVLRDIAKAHGWYKERRPLQAAFILTVFVIGVVALWAALRSSRAAPRSVRLAMLGSGLVFIYIIIRAASFHHVGNFTSRTILGVKLNWIFEVGGIMVVTGAAAWKHFEIRYSRQHS